MEGHELERRAAVERFKGGESVDSICGSLKRSRSWLYKWVERSNDIDAEWYREASRKPHDNAIYEEAVRQLIVETRSRLEEEGTFVGAEMIGWELEARGIEIPSVSTIKRILKTAGVTQRKKRIPKGTKYPAPLATDPGAVHQADFVGPRHIKRTRFYSLNTVDVATARAGAQPIKSRATEDVIPAFWALWTRLGIPSTLQLDNELVFFGNRRYPRAIGQFLRMCFQQGIEVLFIPIREPWRNGVVEKFNDHWNKKFYRRVSVARFDQLPTESLKFEQRHNSRWRYSKLEGHTPAHALSVSSIIPRFPIAQHRPACLSTNPLEVEFTSSD